MVTFSTHPRHIPIQVKYPPPPGTRVDPQKECYSLLQRFDFCDNFFDTPNTIFLDILGLNMNEILKSFFRRLIVAYFLYFGCLGSLIFSTELQMIIESMALKDKILRGVQNLMHFEAF